MSICDIEYQYFEFEKTKIKFSKGSLKFGEIGMKAKIFIGKINEIQQIFLHFCLLPWLNVGYCMTMTWPSDLYKSG